ncbi:MAG: citrate synthase, partial [Chloroflexi bacterium]|nr:citrate synthase [Chloroflexota bacterium]
VDGEAGQLTYRGYSIEDVALRATFEEVVALLYDGELPDRARLDAIRAQLERDRELTDEQVEFARRAASMAHPMFALQSAAAVLGPMENNFEADVDQARDRGIALVAKVGHLVGVVAEAVDGRPHDGPRPGESHASMIARMVTGEEPSSLRERIMNALLVLQADHSAGNASTFTARVVTSTKAEPESVISSAIGALSGPAHGGANEASLRLFQEISDPSRAEEEIGRLLDDRYKIPGFGHRIYHVKDPRSIVIQKLAEEVIEDGSDVADLYEIALTVEQVATDRLGSRGLFPNVDLFSGCIFAAIGIPIDFFTPIFAAARTLGWAVHMQEQWDSGNRIFRPTQVYTGQQPREFVEIEQR